MSKATTGRRQLPDAAGQARPRVAALLVDPRMRARIRDAASTRVDIDFVTRVSDLRGSILGGVRLVILDVRDVDGTDVAPTLRWLRASYPFLPVLVYSELRDASSRDVLRMARAGASQLVIRDLHDTRSDLRAALDLADDDAVADLAIAALGRAVGSDAWSIVEHCLQHARDAERVEDVARALGVTRKTLALRLREAGLPSPKEIVFWARLLLATYLMGQPRHSIEWIAHELGFASGAALHNATRRHTGLGLREIRRRGGFVYVLARFGEMLRR